MTNSCNLKCRHCDSIHELCKKEGEIPIDRIKKVIDEAIELGVEYIVIMGGEPLVEISRLKEILDYLHERKIKFGIVTNGLLIEEHLGVLKKYKFFYFDVSIDGIKDDHEKTRGKGTFDKAISGLRLAIQNKLSEKIFVSSTVISYNHQNVSKMIRELIKIGVENFSLGVYVYTEGMNPKEWILAKEQLLELIENLEKEKLNAGQIIIDIHMQVKDYWDWLVEKGMIKEDEVKRDSNWNVYYQIPNTKIFLKNSYLTNEGRVGIITADGYYLDDYKFFIKDYKLHSLGNVKEKSLFEILNV